MKFRNVSNFSRVVFSVFLLSFLFLFSNGFIGTKQTFAFVNCSDPSSINNPLAPLVGSIPYERDTGMGFYCLVKISYDVFRSALTLVGIGLLLMLAVGGIRYMTAGGDQKAIDTAKKTITTAFVGLGIGVVSVFLLAVVVARIIKPGCNPDDPNYATCTGDPLQLMIPDYFCTIYGDISGAGPWYCGQK